MIGRTLGHYRVEAKIGEGGMGTVYRAHDTHLDRPVSIKVLPSGRVADLERKRRFAQEAKAASALNHPNIVHVYDIDTAEGVDFIAMEFVDGNTLDELISRSGLKLDRALAYGTQIADALSAAHGAGIVHRDVKPSNIMVDRKDVVKVLDFGLAKLSDEGRDDSSGPTQTMPPRTTDGALLGTIAYMSPEQAEGNRVDARSDIFSFGSVLYEMVTGRRAFQGDTHVSTLSAILTKEPPPMSAISGEAPRELERIVGRCLRKDPARRIQHMADVKLALEELKQDPASGLRRGVFAGPHAWRGWAIAASLAVVSSAFLLAWRATRTRHPDEPLRAFALTTFPGVEAYPSLSPDGDTVAFMWTGPEQDNPDIYVQMIGAGSPLRLTRDAHAEYNPAWSPDGRWIAFLRADRLPPSFAPVGSAELWLIPPLGGAERKVTDLHVRIVGAPGFVAWTPDSRFLVVTDSAAEGKADALFLVSTEDGAKRQLTNPPPTSLGDSHPAVSPDGRSLVFRRVPAFHAGELYLLQLERSLTAAGEPRRLTPAALDAGYPAWMPDGKEIVFSTSDAGGLWRLDVTGKKPATRLPYVGENGWMPTVARAQAGRRTRLAYARSFSDMNIWRLDTSTPGAKPSSPPRVAISSTRWDYGADFSPDGRRVAFASNRSGEPEIWVTDLGGSDAVQLTSMRAQHATAPRWSPDGRLIAFHSNVEGQFDVYAVPAAGGPPRRITSHPANDHVPNFSHDGRTIYFSSMRSGTYEIWKVGVSGGDPVQVTRGGGFQGREGRDGAYLYYTRTPGGPNALWRMPTSGERPVKLLDGITGSAFAVLERGIYYLDRPANQGRLQYFEFATRSSKTVARNMGDLRPLLGVSPDGRTILYSRVDSSLDDLMLVENFR